MRVLSRSTTTSVLLAAAVVATTIVVAAPSQGAERPADTTDTAGLQLGGVQPTRDGATISAQVSAAKEAARGDGRTSVIFKLTDDSLASYTGGVPGLRPTSPQATGARRLDVGSPASRAYLGYLNRRMAGFEAKARQISPRSRVTSRLDVVVGGIAMTLPADDVARLARHPQVEAVLVDNLEQLQTDATPSFIGATSAWGTLGGQSDAGEGTIVGVLDSGIWPEHPSLSDPDPAGEAYPASRPSTNGSPRQCDFAGGSNPGPAFTCNNKLIGAFTFLDTYRAQIGLDPAEYTSARDDDGHGTHTATTAAGNGRVTASIFGVPRGQVSGIAPRAHVIAYRVCAAAGCYGSDSAAAVQRAVIDGVDVINFSISGGSNPYGDPVSLAFLDAYNAGVFVAASAGNSGPGANTTDHREPWVTTVAASTGPRSFVGSATLTAAGGASMKVTGATVSPPLTTPAPVVDAAASGDPLCLNGTSDAAFAGKVVLCQRGGNGRVAKGYNVLQRGAVGMILFNQSATVTDLETDNHFLPTVHVQVADGNAVKAFLAAHATVSATITSGVPTSTQSDVMASFSSRGGNGQSLGVSKPDVTAPGVQILAGNTPTPADPAVVPGQLFQAIAGTSMSSPHVAGAAALLKDLHPSWTPGQIHSALMTTANTKTVKEDGATPTDAFDDGSGRIDLSKAGNPFFTIDESGANFVAKQAALQTTNYPSIFVPTLAGKLSLTRTLTSVSNVSRSYSVSAKSGTADFKVTVSPSSFTLAPGASRTLTVTADGKDVDLGQTRFATVTLKSDSRTFTIPVTVVRRQGPVAVTKTCAPDPVTVGSTATCTVTMTNSSTTSSTVSLRDKQPAKLRLLRDSVVGGTAVDNVVTANITLPGRQSPAVDASYVDVSTTPAGYVPLSLFGIDPIGGVGDETITNFTVPAFTLAGQTYTRVGVVSNGYVVLGGGSGADVQFINTDLPDPTRPNNIVAPFWTDLDPGRAGAMRIGTLTDGVDTWIVVDYEGVAEYSQVTRTHSFQVWIGVNGTEDVTVAYGPNSGNGDGGFATVGAENSDGTQGSALYLDGFGRLPVAGDAFRVTGTPGSTSSATVTFTVQAKASGTYVNYAEVTGSTFAGTAIARFGGTITAGG